MDNTEEEKKHEFWQTRNEEVNSFIKTLPIPKGNLSDTFMVKLKKQTDLYELRSSITGCYWIWTNEPVYHYMHEGLTTEEFDGGKVIYNGIAKTDLRSRIKQHLFSADNMNFGALSMDINITYNKFATKRVFETTYNPDNDYTDEYGKYYGKYNRSIPYFYESGCGAKRMLSKEQAIENLYLDNKEKEFIIKEEGAVTFRNGINITQPKHKDFEFRVYVIGIANEGYRNYIEKNWRKYHGKPQLCKM